MRTEISFRWRIKWCGSWTTTRAHYTEEHIRKEHPEAVQLEGTRREMQIPETPEEHNERGKRLDTSSFLNN